MNEYFVSSCQNGGLHKFYNEEYTTLDTGNIRGLTQAGASVLYVKDNVLSKVIDDATYKMFRLPCHGHDIKYRSSTESLLFMGTEHRKLYELSLSGTIVREIEYDPKYWMNCIEITPDQKTIVFLSCKRPQDEAKILLYDPAFNLINEYVCPAKDEIHSPFFYKDELYWCRSNKNLVVKSDLTFSNVKDVVTNYNGYTRGLYIDDDFMLLGTSENRHAENSNCISNLNQGCIHQYKNGELMSSSKLLCIEVYDILKYKNVKHYL
jgi:hypothetical protein